MQKENLKNGTRSMSKSERFTCQDICAILEAGAKSGVSLLQWGDFRAEFGARPPAQVGHIPSPMVMASPESEKVSLEAQEKLLKQQEVAEMLLRDPVRYEELMAKGEIPFEEENGAEDP